LEIKGLWLHLILLSKQAENILQGVLAAQHNHCMVGCPSRMDVEHSMLPVHSRTSRHQLNSLEQGEQKKSAFPSAQVPPLDLLVIQNASIDWASLPKMKRQVNH